MEALRKYLEAEHGRAIRLAEALGISPSAITGWTRAGNIPADRIVDIERVTGVRRELLRPDLYASDAPTPSSEAAA